VFLVAPQSARHWNWEEKGKGKTSSRGMLSASSGSALRPWNLLCLILLHPYATSSYNSGRLPGHRKSTWQSFLKGCLSHPGMLPDRIGSQALRLSGRPDPPSRQSSRQNVSCPWIHHHSGQPLFQFPSTLVTTTAVFRLPKEPMLA
jgi:hypothetical protein